jgi:peptidoglycan/LPS O-acetylase OafA/YrhL
MVSHGFLLKGAATRPLRAISYIAGHLGGTGVALFFAISGYLITTLLLEERDQAGRISLLGFYVRRGFRILPPAYFFLAILAMLGGAGLLAEALRPGNWQARHSFIATIGGTAPGIRRISGRSRWRNISTCFGRPYWRY